MDGISSVAGKSSVKREVQGGTEGEGAGGRAEGRRGGGGIFALYRSSVVAINTLRLSAKVEWTHEWDTSHELECDRMEWECDVSR